jgi:hypothetical protein
MRQAIAKVIAKAGGKDLRFAFHPPKCPAMDNPVAIALKIVPVGMGRFRVQAPAQIVRPKAQSA